MSKRTETKGLYERNGIWYFDFYETPTNRICKSTRAASFLEALKIKEQFVNSLENINHQDFIGGCFFNDVVARFLEDKKEY